MGTPKSPSTDDVHDYLKQFLSDSKVIQLSKLFWLPILYGIILPLRAPKSAKLYQKIWKPEGSPLLLTSQKIAEKTQKQLGDDFIVKCAMRYGQPSIENSIKEFIQEGCKEIYCLPLFPQYSDTTTGSVWQEIKNVLNKTKGFKPKIFLKKDWSTDETYIDEICQQLQSFDQFNQNANTIISFHGIPKSYQVKGDNYPNNCQKTAEAIIQKIPLSNNNVKVCFQSRFGPQEWLKPYTDQTIFDLSKENKDLQIFCPGFITDCLETLEEIDVENRQIFESNSNYAYHYIPCINDNLPLTQMFLRWKNNPNDWLS